MIEQETESLAAIACAIDEVARDEVPLWTFVLALGVLALLIGVGGTLLVLPYGGLCR